MAYDIIGDVHGHAGKLTSLLTTLGYGLTDEGWRHPSRQAIFVGDFIDRGTEGVETVAIVRSMVDSGAAMAVMGNHELNAIAWQTPDPDHPGDYLRPRHREPWGRKNRHQHEKFLLQVESDPDLHADIVSWFRTLPLWIDLPGLRVVHACWHDGHIDWLKPQLRDGRFLTPELLAPAVVEPAGETTGPSVFHAVETLLKGVELKLPEPHHFHDKDGIRRHHMRARWWDAQAETYQQLSLDAGLAAMLPDLKAEWAGNRAPLSKPTFFGHYWMKGLPTVQGPNAICVDYSAGAGGPLAAYRWDAGAPLSADHFVLAH